MSQFELFELQPGLFQPAAVREQASRDSSWSRPSSEDPARIKLWQSRLSDPSQRASLGEQKHKQMFLRDIFEGLLGYQTAGASDPHHLEFELPGPRDPRPADGALGLFGKAETRVRAVIEVKSPGTDLDARSNRKDNLSAVDQGFLYASHQEDCWWVIISNFDELRLYQHQRGTSVYQRWLLQDLAESGKAFLEFVYLLQRQQLTGDCIEKPISLLLAEQKWRAQADVSRRFYGEYQDARLQLFEELRQQNISTSSGEILEATQLLLDRLLFVMFCADRGLLPRDVVKSILQTADPKSNFAYSSTTLWEAIKGLFSAINVGREEASIPGYNGGLFQRATLDELTLEDHRNTSQRFVLRRILSWDQLDFESVIDVDILGHIFENSISDLEQLRAEISEDPGKMRLTWRNREGIFYTPEWVTRYIVRHTVARYLEEHPEVGSKIKVLDPACGSGAFLTQLIPLFSENIDRVAPEEMEEVRKARSEEELTLFRDPSRLEPEALYAAIQRSVYGVDKSRESVEIARLSFWLKTVVRGHPLPKLERNILSGNSLCDDPAVVEEPLKWSDRLPEVASGVDIVVGNPPWVVEVDYEKYLRERFEMAKGSYDLAFIFMELALDLLKPGGYVGFIVPDSILINEETEKVRRLLAEKHTLQEVIKLGEGVFPGVYRGSSIVIVQKGPAPESHRLSGLIVTKSDRKQITDVTSSVNLDVLMTERGSTIRLERILANPRVEFDVFVGEEDEALMKKVGERALEWNTVMTHGRGVELNSAGHVVRCPNCFLWDAPPTKLKGVFKPKQCSHCGAVYAKEDALNESFLISEHGGEHNTNERPFIDGTDVNRYRIEASRRIDISKEGINYKDDSLYASPKIVFRQAGIGITATIDYEMDAYVPQSVYVFRLRKDLEGESKRYKLEYLLGILNSRVMLYWYFKRTGQVEWQSYPRWTLGRVTNLPIRAIDWTSPQEVALHDRIAEEVERLIRTGATGNPEEDLEIERLVMELYNLTSKERQRIWATLSSVQELKIIREVLPQSQLSIETVAA